MTEYVCERCGYHKLNKSILDYVLEPPVYPFMMSTSGILPFMAMEYMWSHDRICQNCRKTNYR